MVPTGLVALYGWSQWAELYDPGGLTKGTVTHVAKALNPVELED